MKRTLILSILIAAVSARAEIFMPQVFSDNMVLQRGEEVKIWGKADKGANVEVRFVGAKGSAKADAEGRWSLILPKMEANASPAEMLVFENGKEGKKISNVLVGEVWVSGGQSNMEMSLKNTSDYEKANERAAKPEYSKYRYFSQSGSSSGAEEPQFDFIKPARWIVCAKDQMDWTNAVAFYFAEKIMDELDVPVGMLATPLGGSSMQAWLPEDKLAGERHFKDSLEQFKKQKAEYDYEAELAKWNAKKAEYAAAVKQAKADGANAPEMPRELRFEPNPLGPDNIRRMPAYLYNAKVAPLAGYTARGVIWYQGEANRVTNTKGTFTSRFAHLINAWREAWGNPEMPFIFAQITSFGKQTYWAETRWEQYMTFKQIKNTGMAVTIDVGDEEDIHPKDKTTVGLRMANIALKDVYKMDIPSPRAPEFASAVFDGNRATVKLDSFGRKLDVRGKLRGFETLSDGNWEEADAAFDGENSLTISAKEASKKIEGVRYAWKSWAQPDICIFNEDGLPLPNFVAEK